MVLWAALTALALVLLTYLAGDVSTFLSGLAEVAAVLALFTLVCAAEALNRRSSSANRAARGRSFLSVRARPARLEPALLGAHEFQSDDPHHDEADTQEPESRRRLPEERDAEDGRADSADSGPDRIGGAERQGPQRETEQAEAHDHRRCRQQGGPEAREAFRIFEPHRPADFKQSSRKKDEPRGRSGHAEFPKFAKVVLPDQRHRADSFPNDPVQMNGNIPAGCAGRDWPPTGYDLGRSRSNGEILEIIPLRVRHDAQDLCSSILCVRETLKHPSRNSETNNPLAFLDSLISWHC